jgi:tetratricopeptide (TPR) repeat protein
MRTDMDENRYKTALAPLLIGACLLCLALASCGITAPPVPAIQPPAAKLPAPPVSPRETPTRQPENTQISGNTKDHFDLGIVHYGKGQLDKAIDEFAYVLEQDPFDLNARTNLGASYFRKGDLAAALREFQAAHSQAPDDAEILYNLGAVKLSMGNIEPALKDFQAAEQLSPDLPDVHVGLGNLYMLQGEKAAGLKELQKALELAPNAPWRPIVEQQIRDAQIGE